MNDKVVIKNKGVSLKHAHRDIVSFEKLRDMVLAHMNNQEIVGIKVPQMRFQQPRYTVTKRGSIGMIFRLQSMNF